MSRNLTDTELEKLLTDAEQACDPNRESDAAEIVDRVTKS